MDVDFATLIVTFFGGLGMFLFGIRFMSQSMQEVAGQKLRRVLGQITSNPILAVITGAVVTAVIQSSSTTTVMVVGLVNAGLMTLPQAIGVIMGANIGTSFTAQVIAFNLGDLSLPAIGIGSFVILFSERRSARNIGQTILGFGLLFFGLTVMTDAVAPLRHQPSFQNLVLSMSDKPLLGVFVGAGMTACLQSSSGTIGILQGFAQEGLIGLTAALPVLIGDNLGTTITALLASLGTSITARRAALSHLLFNLVGAALFVLIMPTFAGVIQQTAPLSPMRQLANAHTFFNITNAVVQLPFIYLLAKLVTFLIPGEITELRYGPQYISDKLLLNAPEMALEQVRRELVRMGAVAAEMLEKAMTAFLEDDKECRNEAFRREDVINDLETAIIRYLVRLSETEASASSSREMNLLLNIANDIERVGDHAENIAELSEEKFDNRLPFSEQATADAHQLYDEVKKAFKQSRDLLEADGDYDEALAENVLCIEEGIDNLEEKLRARHIKRLNSGKCYPESGVIFLDLLSNLERIADHASSIAYIIKEFEEENS